MARNFTIEASDDVNMETVRTTLNSLQIDGDIHRIRIEIEADDPIAPKETDEKSDETTTAEEVAEEVGGDVEDEEDKAVTVAVETDPEPEPETETEETTEDEEDEVETEEDEEDDLPLPRLSPSYEMTKIAAVLFNRNGYLTVRDIHGMLKSTEWAMDKNSISSHLDNLRNKGAVTRQKDDDGYWEHQLTQRGRDGIEAMVEREGDMEIPDNVPVNQLSNPSGEGGENVSVEQ